MNSHETTVRIKNRQMNISIEGLTPMEITAIADRVDKKIAELEAATDIADTSKLGVLAAIHFAAELYNLRQRSDSLKEADTRRIDDVIEKLKGAVDKGLFNE